MPTTTPNALQSISLDLLTTVSGGCGKKKQPPPPRPPEPEMEESGQTKVTTNVSYTAGGQTSTRSA